MDSTSGSKKTEKLTPTEGITIGGTIKYLNAVKVSSRAIVGSLYKFFLKPAHNCAAEKRMRVLRRKMRSDILLQSVQKKVSVKKKTKEEMFFRICF